MTSWKIVVPSFAIYSKRIPRPTYRHVNDDLFLASDVVPPIDQCRYMIDTCVGCLKCMRVMPLAVEECNFMRPQASCKCLVLIIIRVSSALARRRKITLDFELVTSCSGKMYTCLCDYTNVGDAR